MMQKQYIENLAKKGLRADGRAFDEYRQPVSVEYDISAKSAEGSARVKIGDTEVVAGVKLEVSKPYPDTPDAGTLMVSVELTPMASPRFESGPPSIEAIELARVVDRGIRESGALDFKKLCIRKKELMWTVIVDIYPINASGNLFDACALAAIAAIKNARFPLLVEDTVDYKTKTEEALPLTKVPISCTIHKIEGKYFVDPIEDEENASGARLTIAIIEDGKICALQKGGENPLSEEDISNMADLALKKTSELRSAL
ncbi:MAG: exosome complex protein Rrp42 [Candidatus Woesearchaeota archaeon]